MSEIRIDAHELKRFLEDLDILENVIIPKAHRYMRISVDVLEAQIAARTPVGATGNLRSATATEIRGARLNITGEVTNPVLYAEPVERGRRPGKMPPVDAIEYWVIRKGIAAPGPESRATAWLIARAIGAHGTKGAHMFEEGLNASEPSILSLWRGLPGEIVRELR